MKTPNRDLLVLVKDEYHSESMMQRELQELNRLLYHFETLDTIAVAHEIFDMNRGKVIERIAGVKKILAHKILKPFQFACNKN
jgi:hypothetical protein